MNRGVNDRMMAVPEPTVLQVPGAPVPLSRLVLGTMTFGDTVDAGGAAAMLDAALDAGLTGVDTANGYAGGQTEVILGPLMAARRDRIVLATKAGIPHPDAGESAPLSAAGLRAALEGSLRRLQVDRVDLFYLHQPDRVTPIHETLTAVKDAMDRGEIGALGVSNYAAWQIAELNAAADEVGCPRPVVAQQLYNLIARRVEDEYLEFASVSGLLTMVYNPLGGGLLTGKHSFTSAGTGRFGDSRLAGMYRDRYWTPELFAAVERLATIAEAADLTLPDLSLRWLLSSSDVGAVLLGGSRVEQLEQNIASAAAGALTADIVAACDAVGASLRGPMPAYNR
jgi:aryl-alcohol dehydrogenase-like predicted oxidoreductase